MEPVFEQGFSKIDPALEVVWAREGKNDERYVLNHPSAEKGSQFYEARLLKVQDRTLFATETAGLTQLWVVGQFEF